MRVELCRSERRKKLLITCGLIAVFLAYCFASPFVVSAIKKEKSKSLTIVVDAGHGGEDGGVKGAKTGVEEKNINLIVANYLGEMLYACGFNVVYTRRNDVMHNFDGVKNNKKRADMFRRGQIVNDVKPCAVVSIHMNFTLCPQDEARKRFLQNRAKRAKHLQRRCKVRSMPKSIPKRAVDNIARCAPKSIFWNVVLIRLPL